MASDMGRVDLIVTNIVEMYLGYASEDNDNPKKARLNKEELKKLLEAEITHPEVKGKIKPEDIDKAMQTMDKNQDSEINFREFSRFIIDMAKLYYYTKIGKLVKKEDD